MKKYLIYYSVYKVAEVDAEDDRQAKHKFLMGFDEEGDVSVDEVHEADEDESEDEE